MKSRVTPAFNPRVQELLQFSCGGNRAKVTLELRNEWHLYTTWRRRPKQIDTNYYTDYVWPRALMAAARFLEVPLADLGRVMCAHCVSILPRLLEEGAAR